MELFTCPICCCKCEWCGDHDQSNIHVCHFIKCTGICGAIFDLAPDNNEIEELDELKALCAKKFNDRYIGMTH